MLDSAGIAESMDCCPRRGTRALHAATREAKRALGLTNTTIVRVAAAGAIRYVEGPERNFPIGCFFFLREDVMKIKHAFENHACADEASTRSRANS